MQEKKEKSKPNILIIVGFIFLFSGLSLILYNYISNKLSINKEKDAIERYYIDDKEAVIDNGSTNDFKDNSEVKSNSKLEYIAILKIPKIDLVRGLVDPKSHLNSINYNVEIIDGSDMPDKEKGNMILAAHSGNSRISYFRNLDKLKRNDKVTLDYNGITYNYKVVNIYDIEKTGSVNIVKNNDTTTLTLVTCRHNTNKQIIIICELEK